MDSTSNASHDGNKKRPPRGLRRAYWECKKPRIEEHSSQTDISPPPSLNGSELIDQNNSCSRQIGERLSKLEELFERFVCRKSSTVGPSSDAPRSPTLIGSSDKESKFGLPELSDTQSMSSIGAGILGAQTWTSAPSIHTLVAKAEKGQTSSCDDTHRALAALLPSQHDADIIFESSNGWMILDAIYQASQDIYVNRDHQSYALNMKAVALERSIIIARTLLHLAICISSLPPEFDHSRLTSMWDLDATMQNYVATVTSLVTCSDEQMLTLHGLETLLLLALYHVNSAQLRQSWLVIHRGMNLAHLMGFHRIITQPDLQPPIPAVSNAKAIWRKFVDMDRYLGLHLRLPFGSDDYPLPNDADLHLVHRSKINAISGQIAELDREVSPQAYAAALAMDEKLESILRDLPKDFWEVPNIPSTARSPESSATLERLMVQMWHFEMKIFIHLPYLLRASLESRYEFSKVTALQASRNILMRWFALRNANITQACCRSAEIGVFLAAVTLTLDIVIELSTKEKSQVQKNKGTDFAMICRLVGEMEKLAKASPREKIAARSAVVLKKILSSLDPSKQAAGRARLTIPYFGTVELEFKQLPQVRAFDIESDTCKMMNATATGQHLPVFSFISNRLWPNMEDLTDCDANWEIVLFDGLEDRDTEGNWMF